MRINLEVLSFFDSERENHRMSMRMDLEVLSSFDFHITTSTSDSECEYEESDTIHRQILMSVIFSGNQ